MLTITDTASEKAKEVLAAEGKAGWGLRIFMSGSSCCGPSFGLDLEETAGADDKVIEHNGLKVFTDANTQEMLNGKAFDFVDNGQQQGFVIRDLNPGAGSSCGSGGCGSGSSSSGGGCGSGSGGSCC